MNRDNLETIVAEVLNILEHEYDIEGVEDLGLPTVQEIAKRIHDEHQAWLAA